MFTQQAYQAIKAHLVALDIPVFKYTGQYLKGKENTSYRVPAIYVELPAEFDFQFYGKKVKGAKCQVKIHYISYAPFQAVDSPVQDAAVAQHESVLRDIDKRLCGWNIVPVSYLSSEQFIPQKGKLAEFQNLSMLSVLAYSTELYDLTLI